MKKRGRPPKYKNEAERKAAKLAARTRYEAKRRGKSGDWLKTLGSKLSDAAEPADETPPERKGEPFANLPPLDLPNADTTSGSSEQPNATDEQASTSAPEASPTEAEAPKQKQIFDTVQMQGMAHGLVKGLTITWGKYATERGHFAFGEDFAEVAGIAAAVLVKKHAEAMQFDDETAAAYTVGIVLGLNGVQALRAFQDEKKQQKAKEARARAEQPAPVVSNGVHAGAGPAIRPEPEAGGAVAEGPYK